MNSPIVIKQRNLMRKALSILSDISTLERTFTTEDAMINLKIENLQIAYAETMTELTRMMLGIIDYHQDQE